MMHDRTEHEDEPTPIWIIAGIIVVMTLVFTSGWRLHEMTQEEMLEIEQGQER